MFWPYDLGVLYPYRGVIPPWHIGAASSVLAGVSVVAFWQARSRPYLLVGWLWFIGTLVPVIGIVQVGAQAMADRYTYIPLIGLFMGISWMVQTVTARNTWLKRSAFVAVLLLCIGCVSLTRMQVGTWKNSFTLYQHALEVVPENPVALNNLGVLCLEAGILEKAVSFFRKAVDLAPHYQDAWVNMGAAALRTENLDEADRCLLQASRIDVHHTNLRMNIGILMLRRGFPDEAEREFRYVLALNPYHEVAHHRLGALLFHQGRLDESHELLQATIRINPFNAEAYNNLGVVLRKKGKLDEAILMFQKALDLDPGNPHYERNIRSVRFDDGGKSLSNHKRENPWTS
jgi:tetratricopeptide (TPR) repeat protein